VNASGTAQHRPEAGRAFTLIEIVLVMALLATLMAVVAPRISGSIRRQNLDQEAVRFVALTEYARDQAVSQGVPMVVWLDAETSEFGAHAKHGFLVREDRSVYYRLSEDIEFDLRNTVLPGGPQAAIEMGSDGLLATHSLPEVWLVDRTGAAVGVVTTTNGWGYEVVQEWDYATRIQSIRR
jgi:type II secretion system protein H